MSKVYSVNSDQAWMISKAVFRWEGTDAIKEHKGDRSNEAKDTDKSGYNLN